MGTRRLLSAALAGNVTFSIPPNAANHELRAVYMVDQDISIVSFFPHMHLRGRDMTYTAIYPDGRREVILRVPKYDFAWQTDYWLAEPLRLPKGAKLLVSAHFDNSVGNKNNPDPAATVRWGDQTWEEMMIGYITYTVEGHAAAASARR